MTSIAPSLIDACHALSTKTCTAEQLVRAILAAIEKANPRLNCYTHVLATQALEQARASDARRHAGTALSPLDGVPVSIKANIAVEGAPHHAGLSFRRGALATQDAHVVARLRAQGAVLLGLTNMDEGALGARGQNAWFGDVVNPFGAEWLPGGSSAGAAVALAENLCPLAIGSDTIGSVRIPAAFCGVAALKPTYAAVSTRGLIHTHPRFDHIGPMTRTVADLQLALEALAGYDPSWHLSFPVELHLPDASVKRHKIGFVTGVDDAQLSDHVVLGYNAAIARLRSLGHEVEHVDASGWELRRISRAVFTLCEVEMARVHADRLREAPQTLSPQLLDLLRFGATQGSADLQRFENRIAALNTHLNNVFERFDYLLTPTVACVTYAPNDPAADGSAYFTVIASANGRPAIALPLGNGTSNGPPASVQLVGRSGSDYSLIKLAQSLDAAIS